MRFLLPPMPLLCLGTLLSSPAMADPRIDAITASVGQWFTESEYTLGGGVVYAPAYAGSKDYEFGAYPNVHILTPEGFYLDFPRGIGWQGVFAGRYVIALGLGYDGGRAESDHDRGAGSDRLKGMGDVDGSLLAVVTLGYLITPATQLSLTLEQALSQRDRGLSGALELGHAFALGDSDTLGVSGVVNFGDSKYNQTYFGVTEAQARSSRFRAFDAGTGVNSYGLTVNWTHQWTRHWSTDLMAGLTRYAGETADSPLLETRNNYLGVATVNYTF